MRERLHGVAGWLVVLVGLLLPAAWGAQAPAAADAGPPVSAPGLVAASAGGTGVASLVGLVPGPDPAQTEPPTRVCDLPRSERAQPEPTNELRVARDSNGDYWQVQWGCRHRVVPLAMDPVALRAIPQGEDVAFVTFGMPSPVPTPAPLGLPAYAVVPRPLQPAGPIEVPVPRPSPPGPGYLQGYTNRVLVYDPAEPGALYLLEGGLRHRVMVYYPYCTVYPRGLPLCPPDAEGGLADLARGGDPAAAPPYPYLLRRSRDADCANLYPALQVLPVERRTCLALYEQMFREALRQRGVQESEAIAMAQQRVAATVDYVATIEEIPLGEPAPYYGWGRGESVVVTAQARRPDTVRCQQQRCSARFENARVVTIGQFVKDRGIYGGTDIRLANNRGEPRVLAGEVRSDPVENVVMLTLHYGADGSVAAIARGREARLDSGLVNGAALDVGVSVGGRDEDPVEIFEYRLLQR